MFRPIKNKHFPSDSLCSNQIRILGHISCPINFSRMVDLLNNLDAWLSRDGMSSELTTVIIVGIPIEFVCVRSGVFGNLDGGDLEVVLGLARGVGTEEETVDCMGFVGRSADTGSGR